MKFRKSTGGCDGSRSNMCWPTAGGSSSLSGSLLRHMRAPLPGAAGRAAAKAEPGRLVPDVISSASIRHLLLGDLLLVSFSEDPGWWHERLILHHITHGESARFVILSPDGDLYDESVKDWERSYVISGKGAYPAGLDFG